MSSINAISQDNLHRLIGLARGPILIDVRGQDEHVADPRYIPAALLRHPEEVAEWGKEFSGKACVVVDQNGNGDGEGVAAWLRHAGAVSADVLAGGHVAWAKSGGPSYPLATSRLAMNKDAPSG